MKNLQVDVAVIGAGTAGLVAHRVATAAGASALIIEGDPWGTTCARVGCMPSKLLIAAAEAAHAIEEAAGFGVHVDGAVRIDGREVMARVRRERDRFVALGLRDVERIAEAARIRGEARFVNDHTLEVGDHTRVTAKSIVIATGSSATYPDSFETLGDRVIISDDVFDWHDLPGSVAVIGTGTIGLELGQALRRLGVRVAVLGRGGRVRPISDPEIVGYAVSAFQKEFSLEPDARIADMQRDGDRVVIRRMGSDGTEKTEHFDYVLAATGRAPNLKGLCLQNTTLELDAKGMPSFDPETMQAVSGATGKSRDEAIFIAGDVGNFIPLLHEAADEGGIAGANAARYAREQPITSGLRRAPIAIAFTDPQIGIVGRGFRSLQPGCFATGQVSFEDQGRSRILRRNKGLMNVYGEIASGRFLGAEMIAPAAEHLAHLLAWALQNEMTVAQMLAMPFFHPVIEKACARPCVTSRLNFAWHNLPRRVLRWRSRCDDEPFIRACRAVGHAENVSVHRPKLPYRLCQSPFRGFKS